MIFSNRGCFRVDQRCGLQWGISAIILFIYGSAIYTNHDTKREQKRQMEYKYEWCKCRLKKRRLKIFCVCPRQLHYKVWVQILFSGKRYKPFSALSSLVFGRLAKERMQRASKQQTAPLADTERTGPRVEHLWCFSAGEMPLLRNVDHVNRFTFVRMMHSLVPDTLRTATLSMLLILVCFSK